jgi:hypothetical protein
MSWQDIVHGSTGLTRTVILWMCQMVLIMLQHPQPSELCTHVWGMVESCGALDIVDNYGWSGFSAVQAADIDY